ncbi:death-inducer obliterator 1 isoform X2 [Planococcus citri]|uniref:death-inducer obliterator 1 isoform X2 n=1 Tax=Planococcus citri TaxID=170843 RepID=UPI0031F90E24
MSCSQFIEHEEEDKNDTLVIIVNGDGTVTVDPLTLERVLSQQSRPAVSVIRFENTDEPDSQTENVLVDNNEKTVDDKEKPCRKVNLVIEGYYPSASPNAVDRNTTDSVVSSTVGTPPLPTRNSSEFLDLLAEELEIPVSQLPSQSNMHAAAGDGGIGDSLVDAFSEMAPEQLKRVETALHSEKAKQILGDDVTCVLDTLKLNEEHDDWVHLDHCYTNIYGSKKQIQPERMPNVVVQDSEMATMLTIKVGGSGDSCVSSPKDLDANSTSDLSNVSNETLELTMPENIEVINVQLPTNESSAESSNPKRKNVLPTKAKLVTGNKIVPIKSAPPHHLQDYPIKHDRSSTIAAATPQKVKRRSKDGSKNEIVLPERIVTEDEVDGVKVFKPTRNDKRINKPCSLTLSKDPSSMLKAHPQLVQSKLNLIKKVDPSISHPSHQQPDKALSGDGVSTKHSVDVATKELSDAKNIPAKKENNARKTSTPATPETFGPALFSTPDIIRKINSEGGETTSMYSRDDDNSISVDQQTADIEKRMSALENGEAILDELHLQVEMQKEMERITSQSNDDKLLSDLENSADEDQVDVNESGVNASAATNTSSLSTKNYHYQSNLDLDLDLDLEDSENENQNVSTTSKADSLDKSDNSDKNEGEYEDDPNKLWCLCNKPHNNRFMICCDACDNWFHGKCVGISKALGEKMEQDGTEWLCPSCRKEKFAKERENKSKLPAAKSTASRLANRHGRSELTGGGASTSDELSDSKTALSTPSVDGHFPSANAIAGGSGEQAVRRKSSTSGEKLSSSPCVECKEKKAQLNSVYCSAECVLTYVTNSLKNLNNGQRIPLSEDRKINMIDRKTGHRVAGTRAPAVGDLKEWLLRNPNYEIDRPCALPTCRPNYASTFTKSVPKKPANPSIKSKEAMGMALATTPTAAGAVKLPFSRSIQMVKAAKMNQESAALKDGMTQVSMKQFVVKKVVPETVTSNSGVKDPAVASVSATTMPVRKEDFKLKEKQRQIKIIPVQPLPSKPVEEQKEKTTSAIKKSSSGIAAIAATTAATPVLASVSVAAAAPVAAVSEKKKKADPSKKVESKRTETKKKDTASANETSSSNVVTVPNADKIRANVRKGLNELFVNKMKDSPDIKLTEEEVSSLVSSVEEEIFVLHNKDTGTKYKAKYRSLLFNIKQPQNTLFRRITLEKSLSPYDLVRLTPEEMACTELAEWRQREAKHEIDMIKKTELENLQLSKVLVLKTHKGELEIESEPLPPCKPDLIVPDLQSEDMLEEKDKPNAKKTLPYYFGKEKRGGGAASAKDDAADKKKSSDKNASASSTKDKHRKHHDHKDKHKSSKSRRRSSEREKHAGASSKRAKSSHRRGGSKSPTKERHRSGSPSTSAAHTTADRGSRSTEKEKDERSRSRHRHDSGSAGSPSRSRSKRPRSASSTSKRKEDKTCEPASNDVGSAESRDRDNAAEKVDNSIEMEATAGGVTDVAVVKAEEDAITADLLNPFKSVDVDLSDMEPTSTVTIKTPPYTRSPSEAAACVWKGTIVMPDIVRCNVTLKQVSGNCESLEDDMHSGEGGAVGRIDCVGRIEPNIVWDYIGKVKKSGNKDILVLRFESLDTDDQNAYLSFYSYLNKKNRMAVVGNMGPSIKDFYVMPLASHSPIPQVLLPLDGPGFEDSRPHLLLAVVVRSRRRRYHDLLLHGNHHRSQHQKHQVHVQYVGSSSSQKQLQQQDSFTPPHSPTSVFVQTARVPVTTSAAGNEEDEPYSPKDEDDDDNNNDEDGEDNNNNGGDEGDNDKDNEVVPDENDEYDNDRDDADEPYSPSALDEQESKFTIDDSDNCSTIKVDEGVNSSSFANDGDRPELYSPSEHFFNDIESSEVTLPDTLKNLLNRVKNRTSEPLPAAGDSGGSSGGILAVDPIVNAYKKSAANESEEEADDATYEEPAYTPPQSVINLDDDDDDDNDDEQDNDDGNGAVGDGTGDSEHFDNNNNDSTDEDRGVGENDESLSEKKIDDSNNSSNNENEAKTNQRIELTTLTPTPTPVAVAESPEESKANRDPRRKTTAAVAAATVISQPPPPGMEDEFGSLPAVPKNDVINPMMMGAAGMTDAGYGTQIPYAYATPFAAMMSQPPPGQMYLTPAAMYPQPYMAATATPPPPAQIYVPPPPPPSAMLRTDPSMIPLPIDAPDGKRSTEKRKSECEKDDDSSDDKKSSKSYKKHKSYYTSDSKSSEGTRSSPNRHRSSSYESHRRGYQRDDVESGTSSSSRYGHKYGGGGSSSRSYRDRGGYWKSGSDYSSSSHKRYSRNGSSDRDRSSSSKRSRWEGSKHDHEDREHDSKKDKDKSAEHSKKSDSSRRSRS